MRSSAVEAPTEDLRLAGVRRGAHPVGSCAAVRLEPPVSASTRVMPRHGRSSADPTTERSESYDRAIAEHDAFQWFVGIDWGTAAHVVNTSDVTGKFTEERTVKHTSDGLAQFVDWLTEMSGGRLDQVAVAIEIPRGALVELWWSGGGGVRGESETTRSVPGSVQCRRREG